LASGRLPPHRRPAICRKSDKTSHGVGAEACSTEGRFKNITRRMIVPSRFAGDQANCNIRHAAGAK